MRPLFVELGGVALLTWRTLVMILALAGAALALPAWGQSAQYGYDALGRLTSVTYANGSSVTYAYDAAGNRTQVTSTAPPVSATLSASPTSINPGGSATLTWSTTNATSASINNGVGSVAPVSGGSISVSPSVTTTYTLTASGPGGTTTSSATVMVVPLPVSATLSASPTTINQGASTTLTWTTANATSASINNGVGTVTPTSGGSVSVSPSATTTYTLTAIGPGGSANSQATVTVNDPSVNPWTWPTQTIATANNYESAQTPIQTLTGFNQAVTLRAQATNITGNISAAGIYVIKNGGTMPGAYNFIANPSGYVDVSVLPNDTLRIFTDAQTFGGARSGSATISVRNVTDANALLSSYTLNMAVGPDYSVNPWTWANQSINTATNYGSFYTATQTLAGFNQTVTLRIQAGSITGGVDAAGIYVIKNGSTVGNYNFIATPGGFVDVDMVAGDTLRLMVDAVQWNGPATGSAVISVRNLSDSSTLLSSFNVSITIGQ